VQGGCQPRSDANAQQILLRDAWWPILFGPDLSKKELQMAAKKKAKKKSKKKV
jgi:hypothetical protein